MVRQVEDPKTIGYQGTKRVSPYIYDVSIIDLETQLQTFAGTMAFNSKRLGDALCNLLDGWTVKTIKDQENVDTNRRRVSGMSDMAGYGESKGREECVKDA